MVVKVIEREGCWEIKEPRPYADRDGSDRYELNCVLRNKGWTFNGNFEKPTFSPSIKQSHPRQPEDGIPDWCNHFIITDGMIQYCGDCTHELAGQTLELIDFTDAEIAKADPA